MECSKGQVIVNFLLIFPNYHLAEAPVFMGDFLTYIFPKLES